MKECRRSKSQLMQLINEVSFAVNDMNLYLDTHPDDKSAMEFMCDKIRIREVVDRIVIPYNKNA
ncbi:spore coat protein CotJB [Blautia sp.]|uniref:spore coat protein CotJB n=1 Tax=Blautia sp. TaxID=1955243 RepID=UPI00258BCC95|nr:spore coat protein CotJB [Blautia sp.]